jgi:hypothetical protein
MNRRGFLGSILAAAVAPAIVRADSLMRIVAPTTAEVLAVQEAPPAWAMQGDMAALMNARIIAAMKLLSERIEADLYSGVLNAKPLAPERYNLENFPK